MTHQWSDTTNDAILDNSCVAFKCTCCDEWLSINRSEDECPGPRQPRLMPIHAVRKVADVDTGEAL